MSDTTQATATPAAPPAPPPPAPPPAPAPVAAAPATQDDPAWLESRLARAKESERKALLAELGVDDPVKAKAAIAAVKAAEEANKTAEQKAAELAAKLTTVQTDADRLRAIATEHSARMMAVLSPEQQAAVQAIAGDDPAQRLRTIGALAPTWAKDEAAAQAAAVAAAPPPATTAPAATAPTSAPTTSPPDHKSVYSQLRSSNPFEAAAYGLANPEAYDRKP